MAIVATEHGGDLSRLGRRALTWAEVDAVVARFKTLNLYDRNAVPGSVLKIEKENFDEDNRVQLYCYAIAAKRNAMFNLEQNGKVKMRKPLEHGLGHLLNPLDPEDESRDWIAQLWNIIVQYGLGKTPTLPKWLDRPAVSRITASTPELVQRLNQARRKRSYAEQIKPFNFLLAVHIAPFGHPEGIDREHFQLIAPYTRNPRQWLRQSWIDRYSGRSFAITTTRHATGPVIRVKSYRDVLEEYVTHPEAKSAGPDGRPCDRTTSGLLQRRPVHAAYVYHIGKESNLFEEVEQGLVHDLEEIQERYDNSQKSTWPIVVQVLKLMPRAAVAQAAKISERHAQRLRNGRQKPSTTVQVKLTQAAGAYARAGLGPDAPANDIAACAALLKTKRLT